MITSFFRSLTRVAIRHPKKILVLAALVTLAAAPGILHLKLRTDGHALVSPDAPEVLTDEKIRAHFGLLDQMVVLIRPGGTNNIFNAHTLQCVCELTATFKTITGVRAQDVLSLATEPSFRLRPGTLTQQKMLEPALASPAELAQLRDDLRRIELYTGTFVAQDEKSTVILVGVPDGADRSEFFGEIQAIITAQKNAAEEIGVTGAPVAEALFGVQILEDLGVPASLLGSKENIFPKKIPNSLHALRTFIAQHLGLVPLAASVMMLVLLLCFRNLFAALLPLPGVAATMLFVFGLMGWLGVPVYLTTVVMPVLLTVISVTNDIYLFSRYFNLLRERPDENHLALLEETFQKLVRPVVGTALCGVVGFLSFGFSPLVPVKMFGLFTAAGALFGLLLSLTVVPALLALVHPKFLRPAQKKNHRPLLTTLANRFADLGNFSVRHRGLVLGGTLLAIALAVPGLRRLTVQDSWTNGFAPESEFRRVTEAVNNNYFGMHQLFVCAEAPKMLRGEIAAESINGPDIALPDGLVDEPILIVGSAITLKAGPDATWQTHIEFANPSGGKIYARLSRDGIAPNFSAELTKAGRAQFELAVHSQIQPQLIRALGDLGAFIRHRRVDAVGGVLGPADYLATTRFMVRGGDAESRTLTGTAMETKLFWDYYAVGLGQERLHQLVDSNYWRSLTTIFLKDANFQDTARLMKAIRNYEQTNLAPLGIKLSFAGDVAVSQSLIGGIVSTQLQSLGWSLLGIFLVTALLGGSWRWGFFCLLPSLLAVVIKFAVMGWMDISLGVATSMFAAMTLGIGVNCAIHLLESFERARTAGNSPMNSLSQSLRQTGPPAFINTLSVSLGFGVLMLSQVPANARLSLLLVLGLVNCFVVSLLLLPALLNWLCNDEMCFPKS